MDKYLELPKSQLHIKIGELVDTREPVYLDLRKLVETRALIEASSGGGKSTLMRLIAERAAGVMQTLILDHEDEFVTLRQVLDVLLVGDGRDVPITVESAALLARRLADMRISAVVNLYDLDLEVRCDACGAARAHVRRIVAAQRQEQNQQPVSKHGRDVH